MAEGGFPPPAKHLTERRNTVRPLYRTIALACCLLLSAVLLLGGTQGSYSTRQDALNEAGVKDHAPPLNSGLTITKTVENEDGSPLFSDQRQKEFTFLVRFSDGGTYPYTVLNAGGGVVSSGTLPSGGFLRLKHGQQAVFRELPAGVTYTVAEQYAPGYRPAAWEYSGVLTAGRVDRADFRNLALEEETGELILTKLVEGDAPKEKQYRFTVFFSDESSSFSYDIQDESGRVLSFGQLKSGESVLLRHGHRVVFHGLPMGLRYTITEEDYSAEGLYLSMINGSGTIEGKTAAAVAINRYTPPDDPLDQPDIPLVDPPDQPDTPLVDPTDPPPDIPKTGDDRRPGLWLFSLLASLAGLTGCILYARAARYRGRRLCRGRARGTGHYRGKRVWR